jgi:hypothetical protein
VDTTALILDANGIERARNEGYLPNSEFRAQLEMGLARIAFMQKQWTEAERRYSEIAERYPNTSAAPEATYWKGVCRYKATNDHSCAQRRSGRTPKEVPGKRVDAQGLNLVALGDELRNRHGRS